MEKQRIFDLVAKNVRDIMNSKSISNPELARRCKVSSGMISKIVNGNTGITIAMALTLAQGLEVDLSEILKGLPGSQEGKTTKNKKQTHDHLAIGVISISNKRICCIKNLAGEVIGQSELEGGLDLVETSGGLLQSIQETIIAALQGKSINSSILKHSSLKLVTQSYEFEDTRHRFQLFAKKHFKEVLLLSDWQITYLTAFKKEHGISVVIDKGVSLSYMGISNYLRKIGGWKFPVYDLGGENWLGDEAIKHTIEAAEGYVPMSKLAHIILSKFNGKIERITETCFKAKDPDVYSLFAEFVLRAYLAEDEAAIEIIKKGFELISRGIDIVDRMLGKKLSIALNGSLSDIYKPFFEQERLIEPRSDMDKAKLLADITEESLIEHGIHDGSSFQWPKE